MPIAQIEVKIAWSEDRKHYLMEAVHSAMVEAFEIPELDRFIRYIEHDPADFASPPTASDKFTLVEISLFPGRSPDSKRAFYRGIVNRFAKIGIEPEDIRIVLNEISLDNWGMQGGVPACEIDREFATSAG